MADRDIIEEIVAHVRARREVIEELVPCKLILHLPPKDSKEKVRLEVQARLK